MRIFMVLIRTFRHMPGQNLEIGLLFNSCKFYKSVDIMERHILEAQNGEVPFQFGIFSTIKK
jgi:hypothetical protein